jgi:hypothetical protein
MKTLKDTEEIKNTSPYIGYVDLIGKGNVKLTISDVEDASGDKVDGVREAKLGTYALSFKEIPNRKMLLQGRKKKYLMRTFGKRKSDLVGKEVNLRRCRCEVWRQGGWWNQVCRNGGLKIMADKKQYVPKSSAKEKIFNDGGSIIKLSFDARELADFVQHNQNSSGWITLVVSKRREPSEKGATHSIYLDTWQPNRNGAAPPATATRPKAASNPPPTDDSNSEVPF